MSDVVWLDRKEWLRFREKMRRPGKPTPSIMRGAEQLRGLFPKKSQAPDTRGINEPTLAETEQRRSPPPQRKERT